MGLWWKILWKSESREHLRRNDRSGKFSDFFIAVTKTCFFFFGGQSAIFFTCFLSASRMLAVSSASTNLEKQRKFGGILIF